MSFQQDAQKSIRAFQKFSCPALKKFFGENAQIHSYEGSDNPAERELDLKFGVDGVVTDGEGWAHFYASRCSFGFYYGTFTVRGFRPSGTATEIDKLRHGQKVDEPKPEYTIQCYVNFDGRGAVVGICDTVELYQWIVRHKPEMQYNHSDHVGFYPVKFSAIDSVRVFYVDSYGNIIDVTATVKASAA